MGWPSELNDSPMTTLHVDRDFISSDEYNAKVTLKLCSSSNKFLACRECRGKFGEIEFEMQMQIMILVPLTFLEHVGRPLNP